MLRIRKISGAILNNWNSILWEVGKMYTMERILWNKEN